MKHKQINVNISVVEKMDYAQMILKIVIFMVLNTVIFYIVKNVVLKKNIITIVELNINANVTK